VRVIDLGKDRFAAPRLDNFPGGAHGLRFRSAQGPSAAQMAEENLRCVSKRASTVRRESESITRAGGSSALRTSQGAKMAEEYIVLIVEEPWDPTKVTEEQWNGEMQRHVAFAKAVEAAGAQILGGDALQAPSKAVSITPGSKGSAPVFTDGPFSETKEVITGYYKLGVKDAAQARELAALCPTGGHLELYPVMDTGAMQ
jgi:hypothetical protein